MCESVWKQEGKLQMQEPERALKVWSYRSCDEKPGGGALLGTENPGGAEILVLATPSTKKQKKID